MERDMIEDYGLVFDRDILLGRNRLEIVTVGDENCGKTQLIQRFFGVHSRFEGTPRNYHDEFRISLGPRASFDILIYDVKDIAFIQEWDFWQKTVFIFCYDIKDPESFENLENKWLPQFSERYWPYMSHFTVGLEGSRNIQNVLDVLSRQVQKTDRIWRTRNLCNLYQGGRATDCYMEDRNSMSDVFQTALNIVYPRVSLIDVDRMLNY